MGMQPNWDSGLGLGLETMRSEASESGFGLGVNLGGGFTG